MKIQQKNTLYIDADTLLYSSAAKEEVNQSLALHLPTGREKLFESKTDFSVWLKENPKWLKEDFEHTQIKELVGNVRFACASFKQKVSNIVEASGIEDFYVCIQDDGNFRKGYVSQYVDYKGQRTEKPLLFKELFDWVQVRYKKRCIVTTGEETDDFVCRKAWEGAVVAYCDKDIVANAEGWFLNYNNLDKGIFYNDSLSRAKKFWKQVLIGDTTDNIDGILELHKDTKAKYGIKNKGCGETSADKILNGVQTEKEAAERVIEAYQLAWPDDWKQRLQDMCFFLYMRREEGEMFDLDTYLDSLVDVEVSCAN